MDDYGDVKLNDPDKTELFDDSVDQYTVPLEDMWFYLQDKPKNRIPIIKNKPVTIGRNEDQDFVIPDDSVSREHLVLTRKGNAVSILIKGQNGLTIDGNKYRQGQKTQIIPTKQFNIGDVTCGIHSDATVIPDVDKETVIIKTPDAPDTGSDTDDPSPKPEAQPAFNEPPSLGMSFPDSEPYIPVPQRNLMQKISLNLGTDDLKFYIIAGGIGIIIIQLIVIIVLIWPDHSELKSPINPPLSEAVRQERSVDTRQYREDSNDNDLIQEARKLIKQRKLDEAKDYLLDIPEDSSYYEDAQEQIKKIQKINDLLED